MNALCVKSDFEIVVFVGRKSSLKAILLKESRDDVSRVVLFAFGGVLSLSLSSFYSLKRECKTKRTRFKRESLWTWCCCVCWSRREQARPPARERENRSKSAGGGGGSGGGKLASSGATEKEKEKETRVFFFLGICYYGRKR